MSRLVERSRGLALAALLLLVPGATRAEKEPDNEDPRRIEQNEEQSAPREQRPAIERSRPEQPFGSPPLPHTRRIPAQLWA